MKRNCTYLRPSRNSLKEMCNTINVPSASPTNLTFDVGTDTSTFAYLTSSTTTLTKLSSSGTVWIVEEVANTHPIATSWGGSPTKSLHRYDVSVFVSSSSSSAAQLPFVLTALPVASCNVHVEECAAVRCPWIPAAVTFLILIHFLIHLLSHLLINLSIDLSIDFVIHLLIHLSIKLSRPLSLLSEMR